MSDTLTPAVDALVAAEQAAAASIGTEIQRAADAIVAAQQSGDQSLIDAQVRRLNDLATKLGTDKGTLDAAFVPPAAPAAPAAPASGS